MADDQVPRGTDWAKPKHQRPKPTKPLVTNAMHQHRDIPPIWSTGHCARGVALREASAHRSAKTLARTCDRLAFLIGKPARADGLGDRISHLRQSACPHCTSGARGHETQVS